MSYLATATSVAFALAAICAAILVIWILAVNAKTISQRLQQELGDFANSVIQGVRNLGRDHVVSTVWRRILEGTVVLSILALGVSLERLILMWTFRVPIA